ncbi:hypothetical protein [Streptomyces lasiicapitis]|uniref:DUF320 domain-containing protein n=1 Tax=Streptomyces lasiicapitis TaxID=1923961 RepID=A0ABQ2M2E6_9ACTN|nr:hypothetical protein [Streptomyces lasiicapitis]GGO46056.1 hypothetical protein GCM10012286_36070 [Streptomyces lasiicapitis]
MAIRGVAAGAVATALIGAAGVIIAAVITSCDDHGGGRPGPGTIIQTNENGDNVLCVGENNNCPGEGGSGR